MKKLDQKLLHELKDNYTCRYCGGVHYPASWMTKTREKLVRAGVIEHIVCPIVPPERIALRIKAGG